MVQDIPPLPSPPLPSPFSDTSYQLNVSLGVVQFHHHPLFSEEHVIAAELRQIYHQYTTKLEQDRPRMLREKVCFGILVSWCLYCQHTTPISHLSSKHTPPPQLPLLLICPFTSTAPPPQLPLLLSCPFSSAAPPLQLPLLLNCPSSSAAPPQLPLLLNCPSSSAAPPQLPLLLICPSSSHLSPYPTPPSTFFLTPLPFSSNCAVGHSPTALQLNALRHSVQTLQEALEGEVSCYVVWQTPS